MNEKLPRHIALFPISVVKEITQLTARQIRYYEDQGLIEPSRNEGNQRIFSLNDIERFLEIKKFIDQGVNIAGIKAVFATKQFKENTLPNEQDQYLFNMSESEWYELVNLVRKKSMENRK